MKKTNTQDKSLLLQYSRIRIRLVPVMAGLLISFGFALRFYQYLANRSLWLDEALLALNIIDRTFEELLLPLDYNQGAPIGFLWIQKAMILVFGPNEYAFRLFPFLCSIAALPIFYIVVRKLMNPRATLFALALFAITDALIYYGSEFKQYSGDVLICLLTILIFFYLVEKQLTVLKTALFGLLGIIFIYLSHPAIFVLAGVVLTGLYAAYQQENRGQIKSLLLLGAIWAIGFLSFYFISLNQLAANVVLLDYWRQGMAPPLSQLTAFFTWLIDSWLRAFQTPMGFQMYGLAAMTCLIGVGYFYNTERIYLLVLLLPIFFVTLAAMVGRYPFSDRLILFIVPLILPLVAIGMDHIIQLLNNSRLNLVAIIFVMLIFYGPFFQMVNNYLKGPKLKEEIKPAIEHIHTNWQDRDKIYLYYGAKAQFDYYNNVSTYNFQAGDYIVGVAARNDLPKYTADLNQLTSYSRVWILFSHVYVGNGINEEVLFTSYLTSIGGELTNKIQVTGASAYLYQFKQ